MVEIFQKVFKCEIINKIHHYRFLTIVSKWGDGGEMTLKKGRSK